MTFWPFETLQRCHYGVILADPPWRMETWSDAGRNRLPDHVMPRAKQRENSPLRHYQTMDLVALKSLPVERLAARDCVLFLWAVDAMLPMALELGAAWGFTFKTVAFYWVKQRKEGSPRGALHENPEHQQYPIGTGYWTRTNPEQCLLFTRGSPKRVSCNVRKLVMAPRREHSRKPDRIYTDVERLVGGPYCELFSRTSRPGWDMWGTDAGKFEEVAA